MHAALALLILSTVSAGAPTASVGGSVNVVEGGGRLDCVGVLLIPRSPEIDAAIERKFGTLDEAAQATLASSLPQAKYDPPPGSRTSPCGGRFRERFKFSQVPPGEYFLTVTAVPRRLFDQQNFRPKAVEMMQRVSVAPSRSVKVDFKYID